MSKERDDALELAARWIHAACKLHPTLCYPAEVVAALKGPSPSPEEPRCAHGRGPVERCLLCEGLAQNGTGNGFSPSPVSGLTPEEVGKVRDALACAVCNSRPGDDYRDCCSWDRRVALALLDGRKAGK